MPDSAETAATLDQNLRLLIESVRDHAVLILDTEGRVVSWNAGAEAIKGFKEPEILGEHLSRFYPPEEVASGRPERALSLAAQQGRFEEVGQRVRKDGSRFWASATVTALRDDQGRLVGFGKVTRDISTEVEAEERLRRSEARLQRLVETALATISDGLVVLTDSGAVQFVNQALQRIFDVQGALIVGRNFKGLIAAADHDAFDRFLRDAHDAAAVNAAITPRRFAGVRRDGQDFPVEVSLGEITMEGEPLFVAVIRSLSDERAEGARGPQKTEILGRLAGGMAHEFGNLLTVIVGNADDLSGALENRPELKRQADVIRAGAERGADLIQRLQSFARRGAAAVPTDPGQVLRLLRPLLRRMLRENVELSFALAEEAPWSALDPAALEIAVFDFCLRAQEAMPGGGRIVIAADQVPRPEGAALCLTFAASVRVVMEPLALRVDGRAAVIEIDADYDGLPAFRILLPGVTPDLPVIESANDRGSAPRAVQGLVLVAEDDPFVRSYAVACLESLGFKVVAAVDGRDALARLSQGVEPDILFTDIVMPGGVNGWELAEQAIAQRPALKVLFTSGYALETLSEKGHLDPQVRVLNKPYRRAELDRHMRELMEEIAARTG